VLVVRRKKAVLHQEGCVAESIVDRGIVMREVGRHIKDDFHFFEWNKLQTFPAIEVVRGDSLGIHLP